MVVATERAERAWTRDSLPGWLTRIGLVPLLAAVLAILPMLYTPLVDAKVNMLPVVADLENGKQIFEQGKHLVQHTPGPGEETTEMEAAEAQAGIEVPPCSSCHGPAGMGNDMLGTPRLAGQVYQFLVKQLEDFAADRRTDTTMFVMNNNAKGLTTQERVDVAAYLATLTPEKIELSDLKQVASTGTPVGKSYLGKSLVLYGDGARGIPACRSCHGFNGRGVGPIYPKIGRQKYTYLINQLKKWRDGSRANDPLGQMRAVARKLSDDDIYNAASYLAEASPFSLGNTRLPETHIPVKFKQ